MFYIRADGNQTIASGHIMRCMAIARQIENLGEPCTFILADDAPRRLIEENGFSFACLDSQWNCMEEELPALLSYIEERKVEKLLVDSYFVTPTYLEKLRAVVSVFYLDDVNSFSYSVDMLINYGMQYRKFHYEEQYRQTNTKLLLGEEYVPLREEFRHIKARGRQKIERIFITTGGTDPYRMAPRLFEALKDKAYFFSIVSGALNDTIEELRQLERENKRVTIYENVKRMTDVMKNCDLAISAGGTTLYELTACGLPTISYTLADNQIEGAKAFAEQGLIPYAGDVRDGIEACCDRIASYIEELKKEELEKEELEKEELEKENEKRRQNEKRSQIGMRMRKRIDGNGAKRIAIECLEWRK